MVVLQIEMKQPTGSGSGHLTRADLFRRPLTLQSSSAARTERTDSKGCLLTEPQLAQLWHRLEGLHCWHPSNPSGHYRLLLDRPVRAVLTLSCL